MNTLTDEQRADLAARIRIARRQAAEAAKAEAAAALAARQQRVPFADLREGDYLYSLDPKRYSGARGGQYAFRGMTIGATIIARRADGYITVNPDNRGAITFRAPRPGVAAIIARRDA